MSFAPFASAGDDAADDAGVVIFLGVLTVLVLDSPTPVVTIGDDASGAAASEPLPTGLISRDAARSFPIAFSDFSVGSSAFEPTAVVDGAVAEVAAATVGAGTPAASVDLTSWRSSLSTSFFSRTASADAAASGDSLACDSDSLTTSGTTTAALAGQIPLEPKSKAKVVEDDIPSSTGAGPFIHSSGPDTSTAALAGQVPLESKSRAAIVGDDTPSTDAGPFTQSSGPGTTTAALAANVPIEPKSNATIVDDNHPFVQSSGPGTTAAKLAGEVPHEPKSKATVIEDETTSHSNPGTFIQSSGPGTTTATLASQVPLEPRSKATVIDDETPSATVRGPAPDVPEVVKESLSQANESPEAAASAEAVREKKEVESELLQEVKSTDAAGIPAPTVAAATSATAPSTTAVDSKALEPAEKSENAIGKDRTPSRDISPMGRDSDAAAPESSSPIVTTGVGESKTSTVSTPKKMTTPASSAASSPADANGTKDKKKKRMSFFGKLKDKLKG